MPPEQFYAATARRPSGRPNRQRWRASTSWAGVFGTDSKFGVHDRGSQPGHGVEELVLHAVGDVVGLLHSQGGIDRGLHLCAQGMPRATIRCQQKPTTPAAATTHT